MRRLCIFDLDHTLVRSSLDLAAMALDMRGVLEQACGPLPARPARYRVGELLELCERRAPGLLATLWDIALAHERRALADAAPEPGALAAVTGLRRAGFGTAVWTNNARQITAAVLDRFGLLPHFDLVVTRDEMRALKPDPAGWEVIRARLLPAGAVVVGDSWVDGLAAAAAGLRFVAYRPKPGELAQWNVRPWATLEHLEALPAWLGPAWENGADGHAR